MSYFPSQSRAQHSDHEPKKSSPLRYTASNASTASSAYSSSSSNLYAPSRTSTMSSVGSSSYSHLSAGHKRGISETSPTRAPDKHNYHHDGTATGTYKSVRQSLRPLPQAPNSPPPSTRYQATQSGCDMEAGSPKYRFDGTPQSPATRQAPATQNTPLLARGGSVTPLTSQSNRADQHAHHSSPLTPDLASLKASSSSHLRTLSKFAQNDSSEDFSITSSIPSVVGLSGRRQLKRAGSVRNSRVTDGSSGTKGSTWAENNWMEKQRQFLQAYEYLCHIGEAKEWIEDIIHQPLPPIVQLEEALRDGVTLAEIVQAFYPDQRIRIFRHHKLQFRHSDNIALFFNFLGDMELPELFRFELVDLYEKKNIPKVIYCIHALSWLLFRKGLVDFRIGNLVGQLEFEHHELEEVQRGLDRAGISMPSFAGMGASFGVEPEPEPEPEPIETEDERIERELREQEPNIQDLQAQIRGALMRMHLGSMMQGLWDAESALVDLQSMLRGRWAREIAEYRLGMQASTIHVQSAARGLLERARQHRRQARSASTEKDVLRLQSAIRARRARMEVQDTRATVKDSTSATPNLQAAIRGALCRKRVDEQWEETSKAAVALDSLQALARGALIRNNVRQNESTLQSEEPRVAKLQAAIRARQVRSNVARQAEMLHKSTKGTQELQSLFRGSIQRQAIAHLRRQLGAHVNAVAGVQAVLRGRALRDSTSKTRSLLNQSQPSAIFLQSCMRAFLFRRGFRHDLSRIQHSEPQIRALQSRCRAVLTRWSHSDLLGELQSHAEEVTSLQALARAMSTRLDVGHLLELFEDEEPMVIELQAAIRGCLVRAQFAEKRRFFKENMEKVVKVQSFVRAKIQGESYKSLTTGNNPPVGTVKNFVHLLNDSNFDFDEEVEFERLRKTVVQHVRQNEMADQYISQLDIKIALLVKNKITLDEVVKHQKHFGGAAGGLLRNSELSSKDPFDLKALNKNSRRKLEQYQELFFVLQTQPQYLARLFRRLREQATAERECDRIKQLMVGLFGFAQKRREEYYLIKLITRSLKEEIDQCSTLQDFLRSNSFWTKLFALYIKSPRDRKYMRDMIGPIVKDNIIDNPELDLESDPMQIYLSALENEQLRTGQRSQRSPDIPREAAIRDPETKRTFITHLQDLRDLADQFFMALEVQLPKMPFGVRYIAQQMYQTLTRRFPHDESGHILQIVGHWLWKNYLHPAFTDPEKFGVVDRGLSQEHRRNIGEVSKVLGQVAAGRLFGGENVFLQPLNSYIGESIERLSDTWSHLIDVPDAESNFDIDEFNDLYSRTKPTLYIKLADIFSIHHLVASEIAAICPSRDEVLHEIVRDLGSVKSNENELMSVSSSEICLTLNPKLHEAEDPDAEVKALFTETKRCVLYIIRVQSGGDLMQIMVKPITDEDEDRWDMLVKDELSTGSRRRGAYADANNLIDIASMPYSELKRTALENILRLEHFGRLTRHNHYQDLLNAIAVDIRTKHRRRIQRQRELETVKLTLARLNDQAVYLEGQLKTYNDYIEQAMVTLQNKKGKKRFLMPFTKQWDHERELARSGRVPKFGSFKYSAQDLANRGILVSWEGYGERQWDKIDLTISSNEVGVFSIEGSNGPISMPGCSAEVPLDDLLQAQFNNTQCLEFFTDCKVRVNVNLFVHLIMRKFYKDKDS